MILMYDRKACIVDRCGVWWRDRTGRRHARETGRPPDPRNGKNERTHHPSHHTITTPNTTPYSLQPHAPCRWRARP